MTQHSEHMAFQLPGEISRVRCILDSIITTDVLLLSAIDNLGLEDKGMVDYFEKTSAHLLMCDPVAKCESAHRTANRDNFAHASELNASVSSSVSGKMSKGKTGVYFRHYKSG